MNPLLKPLPNRVSVPIATSALLAAASAWASGSSSANYTFRPVAFGGGGGFGNSTDYSAFSTVSDQVIGTSTSASYTAQYGFLPSAGPGDVTGRFVFYNRSFWDGNNAAANTQDDNAIAPDKTALRPGGIGAFANYTSYTRGINGIIVDLPGGGTPSAADFAFKVGNNNTPAGWAPAPAPTTVALRQGAGVGGADRVTLIWADGVIKKQWLEVTVLATANTGLSTPDVFYFGNAIGETGNSIANAFVNGTDESSTRSNLRGIINPAPIDFPYDFNRDRFVNGTDITSARANFTGVINALRLINLGGGDAVPGDSIPVPALAGNVQADPTVRSAASGSVDSSSASFGSPESALDSSGGSPRLHAINGSGPSSVFVAFSAPGVALERCRVQVRDEVDGAWRDLSPQPGLHSDGLDCWFELPDVSAIRSRFFRLLILDSQTH